MISKGMEKEQKYNLRIPRAIFNRLREYKAENPHLSLNMLIVEAILQFLNEKGNKEQKDESR